jgi:type II secretion system protein J
MKRAFTLLELLLAVAIFAVVLASINGVFYSAMRLQRKASGSIEEAMPLEQTLSLLKHDLQDLVPPGGTLSGAFQSGTISGNSSGMMIPPGSTTFYTATGIIDTTSPWAQVQQVVYYLKNPASPRTAGKDLVRAVSRNLLPTIQQEFVEQWLMGGVERLQMAFFDGLTWRDSWDSTIPDPTTGQTNMIPQAIKVQLDLAANYGEPRKAPVQILVPVVIQARTNQTQSGGQL